MDIFLLFGAPQIFQSDNGSEFTAGVNSELKELWKTLIIYTANHDTHKAKDLFYVPIQILKICLWLG